ncbi:MAG: hypothetical protein EXR36_12055 [Betaproteobacteria bacterium]|nr:hypothetical protein [Betaproteobacteria bacterium]
MNRRQAFALLAGLVVGPAFAHSPYRQWAVFRQRFLLVTTTRDDKGADDLGEEIARIVLAQLPDSRAQVSRARDWSVLASLLTTKQTELAVMAKERSAALYKGETPYQDFGPSPLRVIVQTDRYRLVCRDDFPVHHAYLLCEALMEEKEVQGFSVLGDSVIPAHPGAMAYMRGDKLPPASENEKEIRRAQ